MFKEIKVKSLGDEKAGDYSSSKLSNSKQILS